MNLGLATPIGTSTKYNCAIIAEAQSSFSRAHLSLGVGNTANDTTSATITDVRMRIRYNSFTEFYGVFAPRDVGAENCDFFPRSSAPPQVPTAAVEPDEIGQLSAVGPAEVERDCEQALAQKHPTRAFARESHKSRHR